MQDNDRRLGTIILFVTLVFCIGFSYAIPLGLLAEGKLEKVNHYGNIVCGLGAIFSWLSFMHTLIVADYMPKRNFSGSAKATLGISLIFLFFSFIFATPILISYPKTSIFGWLLLIIQGTALLIIDSIISWFLVRFIVPEKTILISDGGKVAYSGTEFQIARISSYFDYRKMEFKTESRGWYINFGDEKLQINCQDGDFAIVVDDCVVVPRIAEMARREVDLIDETLLCQGAKNLIINSFKSLAQSMTLGNLLCRSSKLEKQVDISGIPVTLYSKISWFGIEQLV